MKAAREAGPKAPGSKEVPEGAPGCLEGLTFVFTGELESLGREDANELAKRYGGYVFSSSLMKILDQRYPWTVCALQHASHISVSAPLLTPIDA